VQALQGPIGPVCLFFPGGIVRIFKTMRYLVVAETSFDNYGQNYENQQSRVNFFIFYCYDSSLEEYYFIEVYKGKKFKYRGASGSNASKTKKAG
jgi:hypothetical protein